MRDEVFTFLNRHIRVSHETAEKLFLYHDTLLKWQNKINLISKETIVDIWNRHFLDSLQLTPHLPDTSAKIADIGSGSGFPGMALAIYGQCNMHLIESDTKKIAFLREVSRLTATPVTLHHNRVEQVKLDNCDVIISRAVCDLNHLLKISLPLVSHGTRCLFHKGKNYSIEIEEAKKHWEFDCKIIPSITDANAVILDITAIRRLTDE